MTSSLVYSLVFMMTLASRLDLTDAVKCYTCRQAGSLLTDNGCGILTSEVKQRNFTENCTSCSMAATTSAQGGRVQTLERTCEHVNHTMGCRYNTTHHTQHCYCHSDDCNDNPIYFVGSLSCYACTSADFINNGCGVTLDPTSPYIRVIHGCVACNTQVTKTPNGITHYTRSCVHDVDTLIQAVRCSGGNSTFPGTCDTRCSTTLCNHSDTAHLALSLRAALFVTLILSRVTKYT